MKNYITILLFIAFFSCKKENNEKVNLTPNAEVIDSSKVIANTSKKEKIVDCDQLIYDLVASTDVTKGYKDFFTRIEKNDGEKIVIQVYFENNLSDDAKAPQIVESTIAWLEFIPSQSKLFNSTIDPDDPVELKFDRNLIKEQLFKSCNVIQDKETIKNKTDCITEEIEMGSKEVCFLQNTTLKEVYSSLIKNKLVNRSEKLQKELPLKSERIDVNAEGLIDIDYKVTKNKIEITMSFEGGETTILLEQKGSNVQRSIVLIAD
jgi:hypothetical protein